MRGLQVGIHRTSDRTIEFFTQYSLCSRARRAVRPRRHRLDRRHQQLPDSYSPALGVVVSRELGRYGAIYVEPMWVNNSNPLPCELVDDNDTFMFGLGARIRIRPTVYLVGEFMPRSATSRA